MGREDARPRGKISGAMRWRLCCGMADASSVHARYTAVGRDLNKPARRLFGAAEARTGGYGGITASSRAAGLARGTIGRGLKHLDDPAWLVGKVRRPGSGRPALTSRDTTLLEELHKLQFGA